MRLWSWVKQILLLCKQAGNLQCNLNTAAHKYSPQWVDHSEFWSIAALPPLEQAEIKFPHVCETFRCKCLAWKGMGEIRLQGCRRDHRADGWFMLHVHKLESMRSLAPRTNISFILSKCQQAYYLHSEVLAGNSPGYNNYYSSVSQQLHTVKSRGLLHQASN